MGLDINAVQFLLRARKNGLQFGKVLTIGRLNLDVFPAKICELLRQHGLSDELFRNKGPEKGAVGGFADDLFRALGATSVHSLDASDYEGATLVHDLNQPIPAIWRDDYDVVYDGGTLEHVFNFPVALRNCMELVRPGGELFLHTPGNNWFGHGFYQFSPELFFRAFSAENGFQMTEMIAYAVGPHDRWYRVSDPQAIRSRVELISYSLICLLVQAKKTKSVEIFQKMPMQSDYSVMWQEAAGKASAPDGSPGFFVRWLRRRLPKVAHLFKAVNTGLKFYRSHSLRNRRFFTPVKKG